MCYYLTMDSAYGLGFIRSRGQALLRSDGICQFCGQRAATDGHHWAESYPKDSEITSDDDSLRCALSVMVSRQHSAASLERAETSFTSEQPSARSLRNA